MVTFTNLSIGLRLMTNRRAIKVTDEMFDLLWEKFPYDEELIRTQVQEALYDVHVPNQRGRTQSGIRVYRDDGFQGSGYIMVHWDDAKKLDWCLDNGYMPRGLPPEEDPIVWDNQPERERSMEIKKMLWDWL